MKFFTHKLFFSLLSIFLFGSNISFASHIVGGDIAVRYLSPNNYEVTLTFFRDCGSTTGFDSPISLGVFNKDDNVMQQSFSMSSPSITTLTMGDACYTPNLCIQKAVYVTNVVIPNRASGYYISWIRCCRNAVITNIVTPGDDGYVFYTEIPDPAIVNSSPVFSSVPDGYMCRNYLNTDVFSATDADGDQLVYSFSTPLSCNPNGQCSPFSPNPGAAAGPYGTIVWQAGYSLANPMGDPAMAISSSTGVITGTPPNLGIFVISVKVSEYRGAVKIGEVNRDFQFDVLSCTVLNLTINPGNPVCTGTTATITTTGVPSGFTYTWAPGGQTTSSIVVTPSIGSNDYTVTATNGSCSSTTTTTLVVNQTPTATITNSGNACAGQNVTLTASGGSTYSWSNGAAGSTLTGVANGTYTVWVTNASNCTSTATGIYNQGIPPTSTYTWTGGGNTTSNNWFDGANWGNTAGCIPACGIDVFIPNTPALAVSNPPKINSTTGAAACRNITIANGNTVTVTSPTGELDVCGDFIQNGGVDMTAGGTIKFMGNVAQTFYKSSTATLELNNVILANTATLPKLTIADGVGYQDMTLSAAGTFSFQATVPGVLFTEGNRKLVLKNTATGSIAGYGTTNYVYGRLNRYVVNNTTYYFPVGNAPVAGNAFPYELMKIDFTAISGGLTNLTVLFDNFPNSFGTGLPIAENSPSTLIGNYDLLVDNGGPNTSSGDPSGYGGLWTVLPNAGTATYNMTLYGRNYDNAGSYQHTIVSRNEYCPATWTMKGTYASSSVAGNVVTVSRTGVVGFSQKGIAKAVVPLPVDLILFDATCSGTNTVLSWATASETNNNYFSLERSCDENFLSYQTIAIIPGAGNSSTLNQYSYTDKNETPGECFFRLSQTDFNGMTTEFTPVTINCKENADFNFVGALPNPAIDEVNILFTSVSQDKITMSLTDIMGKQLLTKDIIPELGLNKYPQNLDELTSGIYFIKLDNGKKSFIKKIVKK